MGRKRGKLFSPSKEGMLTADGTSSLGRREREEITVTKKKTGGRTLPERPEEKRGREGGPRGRVPE